MKIFFDFFPIILFFITYKFAGIYYATAVAIGASLLQVGFLWLKNKRLETMPVITLFCVVFLGGATLIFHNELFIKWKPTAIYWIFSLLFLATQFIGNKPLIRRLMEEKVVLPDAVWKKLNLSWVIFFLVMGALNIFVAYHFSTDIWVDFKLFGSLGLTVVFVLIQAVYMTRHVKTDTNNEA